jgi:hypothetical protein
LIDKEDVYMMVYDSAMKNCEEVIIRKMDGNKPSKDKYDVFSHLQILHLKKYIKLKRGMGIRIKGWEIRSWCEEECSKRLQCASVKMLYRNLSFCTINFKRKYSTWAWKEKF